MSAKCQKRTLIMSIVPSQKLKFCAPRALLSRNLGAYGWRWFGASGQSRLIANAPKMNGLMRFKPNDGVDRPRTESRSTSKVRGPKKEERP